MNYFIAIYSHSSFSDILTIQNDYLKEIKGVEKILFIDKIEGDNKYNFDRIIFYDDSLNYSKKVYTCLEKINTDKYILFIHDNDILIKNPHIDIINLTNIMSQHNIDRIDLQNKRDSNMDRNIINYNNSINLIEHKTGVEYNYNVNPAIYRFNKFKNIMFNFDCSYRDIELVVQNYCVKNLKTYTLYSNNIILGGWMKLTHIFLFFHITHHHKLLPPTKVEWMDNMIQDEYNKIIEKYNIGDKRKFWE